MQNKLRTAFLAKEKADTFLANLEKLKEEKNIGDAQYRVLKIEYTQLRDDALSQINTVKNAVRKELDEKITKLEIAEQELGYLEARFKVGQLSSKDYLSKSRGPKNKLMDLEKRVSDLQTFLDASISAELGGVENARKMLGLNIVTAKKQPAEQRPNVSPMPAESVQDIKYPTISSPLMSPPPLVVGPMPVTTPVSVPTPPIPPLVKLSDLQIMPDKVVENGNVGILITVINVVSEPVQYKIDLKINGSISESRDINLMPGEAQELTFIVAAGIPGNYKVEIGDLSGIYDVLSK